MDEYGQSPYRIQTAPDSTRHELLSCFSEITTLRTFFFLFSPIKTWTAVREPGVCESGDREVPVEWKTIYTSVLCFSSHDCERLTLEVSPSPSSLPKGSILEKLPAGFVVGLLHPRLWIQLRPKSVDFHDAENRQRQCRMIIRQSKDP
ncbi:hypothetical protein TNCV_1242681 [Trichonephila clavipes]|nr:hypothetical protein TNCV_1242681 [Trichonephila clavipes]